MNLFKMNEEYLRFYVCIYVQCPLIKIPQLTRTLIILQSFIAVSGIELENQTALWEQIFMTTQCQDSI